MSRLDNGRLWVGAGIGTAVLVVLAGWFVLIGPQLAHAADLRDQTASAQQDNVTLTRKVTDLKDQDARRPELVAELRRVQAQLPAAADLSGLAIRISAHAAAAHVRITDLTVSPAVPVKAAVAPAPTTTESGSGTGTATATGTGTAAGTATATGTAPATATASGQLYDVPVTVTTSGSLAQQRAFLDLLSRTGPRAVLVGSTQLGAGGTSTSGATGSDTASLDAAGTMTTDLTFFVAPAGAATAAELEKQLAAAPAG